MAASVSITPIRPGMEAGWREFVAELQGTRRIDWVQSQRRRGITREVISIAGVDPSFAVVYSESSDPSEAVSRLEESDEEFDRWYRSRLADLLDEPLSAETVFDSAPKPGPWRGWR